ncbi:TPA: 50S ribosomal protein L30 [Candidatus Woesearchaeota archaeon]|nr:50S ribosomal protein L30 [Candidatus Woesearchaeota archaeon]
MAKKQKAQDQQVVGEDSTLKELRQKITDNKVVLGTERVLKALREQAVERVLVARNCPDQIRNDLVHYAALVNIPIITLGLNNEELGVFCKKNFFVSVLATQ